jgi:AcrR family transcriptional regulator
MNVFSPAFATGEIVGTDGEPLPGSVIKILEGALSAIIRSGARRLSMSAICEASGVSRGTLYRYFSTKEEVLAAVSEFVSLGFENGVRAAADPYHDPIERLQAVLDFFDRYTRERTPDGMFELEPAFHLAFFRSHFTRHKAALRDALCVTFDYVDSMLPKPLDRDAVAEAFIRMQLSSLIVPLGRHWSDTWVGAPRHLQNLIPILAGRALATEET